MDNPKKLLVSIVGPTASGKTALSIKLAKALKAPILSADSRQFYREMNIGTAKPTAEELSQAPHHFINSLSVSEEINVSDFEYEALKCIEELHKQHDIVFLVGGSGLYLHAIWNGFDDDLPGSDGEFRRSLEKQLNEFGIEALQKQLKEKDPEIYKAIDQNNAVRLMRALEINHLSGKSVLEFRQPQSKSRPFDIIKIGLEMDREELYTRINLRVDQMISDGLLEEARSLRKYEGKNALKTVGYQELFSYFRGDISLEKAIEDIKVHSRRYAKRQMTWFKRYDDILWHRTEDFEKILRLIKTRQL